MFDTSSIDWFIWEDVETAHVYRNNTCEQMSEDDFSALAIATPGEAKIIVEVGRYADTTRIVRVPTPCTIRALLTAIKDFYSTPIKTPCAISQIDDDGSGYKTDVLEKLRQIGRAHV